MTTYIYETIPARKGEKVRQFEIRQSMRERALTEHPETGVPIRRVVSGGYGILKSGQPAPRVPARSGGGHCCGGHCCGGGGCGCHH